MKYKVGDKIRYVGVNGICHEAKKDIGKTGVVVSVGYGVGIYLPDSDNNNVGGSKKLTWICTEKEIELYRPNEQLLFSFMY